jgi:hypothetical protein
LAQDERYFKEAEKVFCTDYEGRYMFWIPPGGHPGEFFRSRTELETRCEELGVIPPRWCWATEQTGFLLDAECVLEGVVTRANEEVRPLLEDSDVERLQKVLDDWAMSVDVNSYDVDYDLAVILDRTFFDKIGR